MENDKSNHAHQMSEAAQPDPVEHDLEAVRARLGGHASEPRVNEKRIRQVEMLLRTAPMESPSAGFHARVMAAIAAMTFPHMLNRRLSLSLALALAVATAVALPLLVYGIVALFSVLADPAALHEATTFAASTIGSAFGLVSDYAARVESLVDDMPMVPALVTTSIPLAMLVAWAVWYLLGGPRWLLQRVAAA
jgi:hypothetical protein